MATTVVLYDYTEDPELQRVQDDVRPKHREFLFGLPGLLLTGPTDGGGAVLVFDGEPAQVEALLDGDPFLAAGVITRRRIQAWNVVGGALKDQLTSS